MGTDKGEEDRGGQMGALHRQLQDSIAELRSLIDRYGPIPGTESPNPQKIIQEYPSMVADDRDFEEVK